MLIRHHSAIYVLLLLLLLLLHFFHVNTSSRCSASGFFPPFIRPHWVPFSSRIMSNRSTARCPPFVRSFRAFFHLLFSSFSYPDEPPLSFHGRTRCVAIFPPRVKPRFCGLVVKMFECVTLSSVGRRASNRGRVILVTANKKKEDILVAVLPDAWRHKVCARAG